MFVDVVCVGVFDEFLLGKLIISLWLSVFWGVIVNIEGFVLWFSFIIIFVDEGFFGVE